MSAWKSQQCEALTGSSAGFVREPWPWLVEEGWRQDMGVHYKTWHFRCDLKHLKGGSSIFVSGWMYGICICINMYIIMYMCIYRIMYIIIYIENYIEQYIEPFIEPYITILLGAPYPNLLGLITKLSINLSIYLSISPAATPRNTHKRWSDMEKQQLQCEAPKIAFSWFT